MAGPKYFIYGGNRWREVDTTSGSVVGWGNVQFLTLHNGRLEVAQKNPVLRGLRSLAASKPTTVHDGSPLSQIRYKNVVKKKKKHECIQYPQQHCCCSQNLSYKSDVIFNNLIKAATTTTAVQCSLNEINRCIEPKSTLQSKTTVINYNENQVKTKLAKPKRSSDDDIEVSRNVKSTKSKKENTSLIDREQSHKDTSLNNISNNKYDKKKLKTISAQTSSSEDEQKIPKLRKSQRLNLEKRIFGEGNRLQELLKETPQGVINDKHKKKKSRRQSSNENEVKVQRKNNKSPQKNQLTERKETRNSLKNKATYQTNSEKYDNQSNIFKITKRKLSVSDDECQNDRQVSKLIKMGNNLDSIQKKQETKSAGLCKELLIEEEDILLLRTFINKDKANIFNVDLEQFDADDNYKSVIFYKINPLVHVEKCKEIAAMLREQRSKSNDVTLEDFISKLGLRSVLDSSSQSSSKYKMRPRRNMNESQKQTSESEVDKENFKKSKPVNNKPLHSKVLIEKMNKKNRISTRVKKHAIGLMGKMMSKPKPMVVQEVVSLSSDSDSVFERSLRSQVRRNSTLLKRDEPTGRAGGRPSGRGGREYSRAEDEALVRWVAGEARARRVNGNQLWRELQPEHQRATGHFRSWHSLRNRYLRYLLPSLHRLELPPQEATRLRAAAATGELKSRKKPQRRNSLLTEPRVRSAWSRRPHPTRKSPSPSHSPSPSRTKTPSPRKSLPPAHSPRQTGASSLHTSSSESSSPRDSLQDRRNTLRRKSIKPAPDAEESTRRLRSSFYATDSRPEPAPHSPTRRTRRLYNHAM